MRPSRYLFALAAIFIVLFGVVIGFGSGSLRHRLEPKLGLDLVGGTTMTLVARTADGSAPDAARLEQAREIIEKRVNAYGVAEAEVVTEGNSHIVVSVPGQNNDSIRQVGTPAELRFRKVIGTTQDSPTAAAPSPSASANPSTSPSPSAGASPSPSTEASPSPSASAAPTSPGPSPTATPTTAPTGTPPPQLAAVLAKLGSAAAVAANLDPVQFADGKTSLASDPATMAALEPFRSLTPEEVAVLPYSMQFAVPQVTCEKLNGRPAGSIQATDQPAVACLDEGNTKYLLDVAKVVGTDLDNAGATIDPNAGSSWKVDLTFNTDGTKKWTDLTREAFNNADGACRVTQPNKSAGGSPVCMVAVVLDNTVVSAPAIQGVLSSTSEITGGFNKTSATLLANQLKFGALPLTFDGGNNLQSISATLGQDYLRAGLLAAGIGLLLVVVYAFFYYRLLGLVITLSLVLSALLTFGMLVFLGRQVGFTLSLAGIAGFIVSLGVAADSFVIYFERLKDEIREGRSPRSAVPRAWARARRTIITANAVTVLAAVVLYLVGIGAVRGFAFALGLATILDLLIVFLFRHPMMTMLARTPAFLSPRVSGLGRVLHHAREDGPTVGTRAKEA
jgi:preprotein translocase subunit SecD